MKVILTEQNYCATVVALSQFVHLPNCDRIQAAIIFGNHVIVSKESQPGDVGLYFPVETQLSHAFLFHNNLYSNKEYNMDTTKKGFFELNGRVKAANFRGHKSQGFFVPMSYLSYLGYDADDFQGTMKLGTDFNFLDDNEICCKYVIKNSKTTEANPEKKKRGQRKPKLSDNLVPGQFEFHVDTSKLERNLHHLHPSQIISITDKWHGTSVGFHKILTKRTLTLTDKVAKFFGVKVSDEEYKVVWNSRKVLKGVGVPKDYSRHYYDTDIWGAVAENYGPYLPAGACVYGEIVGYAGLKPIQKNYTYGLEPGQYSLVVYRVTFVGPDNQVFELGYNDMVRFCKSLNMLPVSSLYYGEAKDFGSPELKKLGAEITWEDFLGDGHEKENLTKWRDMFFAELMRDYVEGRACNFNQGGTPAEGVVVRIEEGHDTAMFYKAKNHEFLLAESKLLDTGEEDMESAQCAPEEEVTDEV